MKKTYVAAGIVPFPGDAKDICDLYSDDFIKTDEDGDESYTFHSKKIDPQIRMEKYDGSVLVTVISKNELTARNYWEDVKKKLVVDLNPLTDILRKFYQEFYKGDVEFIN